MDGGRLTKEHCQGFPEADKEQSIPTAPEGALSLMEDTFAAFRKRSENKAAKACPTALCTSTS